MLGLAPQELTPVRADLPPEGGRGARLSDRRGIGQASSSPAGRCATRPNPWRSTRSHAPSCEKRHTSLESKALNNVKRGVARAPVSNDPHRRGGPAHRPPAPDGPQHTRQDVFEARSVIEPAAVRRLATLRPAGAIKCLQHLHDDEMHLLDDLGQ